MLYLNVTGRNDIVSSMPRDNRSFFYPSVSLGWVFTEVEALKNDILTFGKIRGSYAEVGMAGEYVPSYYYTQVMVVVSSREHLLCIRLMEIWRIFLISWFMIRT